MATMILPRFPFFGLKTLSVRGFPSKLIESTAKMANLIMNLPRKWQIYDRVRGVALSQEKFQFIFTYEHDSEMVLKKGVQTFNEWTLAIERWTEFPPPDFLQIILVWVQIRNIPINHYTTQAITALGEIIGQVKEVAFDPLQP